jgi:16S rRNA (adenine(1408)-N(1))-methyltransferase
MAKTSAAAIRAVPNAVFALGSIESLPPELDAIADRVTVTLPWGSLLRAVALPDPELLQNVVKICRAGAIVEALFSTSARDSGELRRIGLAGIDPLSRCAEIEAGYAAAGMCLQHIEELTAADLRSLGTTWAKRLCQDPDRRAWRLTARVC